MKKIFGLIGFPLSHSFSRNYFTEKFLQEGTSELFRYENFELQDISGFPELLQSNPLLYGLNVTIPHKEKIIPCLDELKEYALQVNAVNTILIRRDEHGKVLKTEGFNTDVTGFYATLKPLLKAHHTGAMVLGTGGASKAVVFALRLLNLPCIKVSRIKSAETISYSEITGELISRYPVIINTTPLGTFPDVTSLPELPYHLLNSQNLLYDLVYNPPESQFLFNGRAQGAQTMNGYDMLVAQAEASWQIWDAMK